MNGFFQRPRGRGGTLVGISNGIVNAQMTAAVIGFAPQDRAGLASGLASMSRHAGFAIGIALLGLAFAWSIDKGLVAHGVKASAELVEKLAAGTFVGLDPNVSFTLAKTLFTRSLNLAIAVAAVLAAGA